MEDKYVSIEDAQKQFPNEWLLLGNPVREELNLLRGILLYHSKDKKEVCYLGKDKTEGYDRITLEYTGSFKPRRKIGVMRRLN